MPDDMIRFSDWFNILDKGMVAAFDAYSHNNREWPEDFEIPSNVVFHIGWESQIIKTMAEAWMLHVSALPEVPNEDVI